MHFRIKDGRDGTVSDGNGGEARFTPPSRRPAAAARSARLVMRALLFAAAGVSIFSVGLVQAQQDRTQQQGQPAEQHPDIGSAPGQPSRQAHPSQREQPEESPPTQNERAQQTQNQAAQQNREAQQNQAGQQDAAAEQNEAGPNGIRFVTGGSNAASQMRIPRTDAIGPKGEWRLPALDLANSRYSQLNQIDTENAATLQVISVASTGIPHGHEGQPLVVGDTMYVVTPFPNYLIAYDLTQPGFPMKWKFDPLGDPTAVGIACCDIVNRGASYGDGKIVYSVLSGTVVAVDAKTGKEVWATKIADYNKGATLTGATFIVKDKVYVGVSGAELGVRGWIKALSLKTGEVLWTAYSTGPDKDTLMTGNFHPFYKKDQGKDLGVKSWPPDQWQLGGGTVWGWISYDPETNLIFYGTSNPGVWNPDLRPGENKWSSSIIARDADTGQARWAYQVVPHDAWDYDEIMENIVVDMPWNGKMRKLLIHPGRTGFVFVLDRETGELLSAQKFVDSTNWASAFSLETGYPSIDPRKRTHQGQVTHDICPSSTGGKEVFPSAVSPRTGLLYIPAHNFCMNYEGLEANYIAGTPYLGADVLMYPGPGKNRGRLVAWDIENQKPAWGVDEKYGLFSGILATAGDVVFYGTMDGWFKAIDATNGTPLWKFKTGSGIVGNPMTFIGPDGRQYVVVYSGIGGWVGANVFASISANDPTAALGTTGAAADLKQVTAPGDAVYVFALPKPNQSGRANQGKQANQANQPDQANQGGQNNEGNR
ncbi:MAG TPA: PQQ-dependent dehydrogenase, methanol/ethanol family [Gammaproteobacteria bacterium]|nr:PQQ-dependent dehydrogenase, methanol/ethanol family [Gammaproteobacteria bacterium]